jgi:seryl-tRNA synthetase
LDFKWIRDNKDAVAQNIRDRNSSADVDLVVQLYDKSLALGQVFSFPFLYFLFIQPHT